MLAADLWDMEDTKQMEGEGVARNLTIRLDDEVLKSIQGVALVDATSMSNVIKAALGQYIETRKAEGDFQEKVLSVQQEVFKSLLPAGWEDGWDPNQQETT
jgi:predicted transcriptional regulator